MLSRWQSDTKDWDWVLIHFEELLSTLAETYGILCYLNLISSQFWCASYDRSMRLKMWLLGMDPGSSWGIVKSSNVHARWTWSTWSTELSGQAQLAWDPAGLRTLQGHTRLKSY